MQRMLGCFIVCFSFLLATVVGFAVLLFPLSALASMGRPPSEPGGITDVAAGLNLLVMIVPASLLCGLIGAYAAVRYVRRR